MISSLADKLRSRKSGICLYGFAPPKQATPPEQLEAIVAQHVVRLGSLPVDGLIIYDIQDETERTSTERPFPFLPTLSPEAYAHQHLACLTVPKIVYRCVNRDTADRIRPVAREAISSHKAPNIGARRRTKQPFECRAFSNGRVRSGATTFS